MKDRTTEKVTDKKATGRTAEKVKNEKLKDRAPEETKHTIRQHRLPRRRRGRLSKILKIMFVRKERM
jgi:hypothetical protein